MSHVTPAVTLHPDSHAVTLKQLGRSPLPQFGTSPLLIILHGILSAPALLMCSGHRSRFRGVSQDLTKSYTACNNSYGLIGTGYSSGGLIQLITARADSYTQPTTPAASYGLYWLVWTHTDSPQLALTRADRLLFRRTCT